MCVLCADPIDDYDVTNIDPVPDTDLGLIAALVSEPTVSTWEMARTRGLSDQGDDHAHCA